MIGYYHSLNKMKKRKIKQILEDHDKGIKAYIDMKFRARFKPLALFTWMGKHLWQTGLIVLIVFSLLAALAQRLDPRDTIEEATPLEFKDN